MLCLAWSALLRLLESAEFSRQMYPFLVAAKILAQLQGSGLGPLVEVLLNLCVSSSPALHLQILHASACISIGISLDSI